VYLQDDDVKHCLEIAREMVDVYQRYALMGKASMRSVDDMEWCFREYLGKTVVVRDLQLEAGDSDIRGLFLALADGSYEIYLLGDMGDRERRFVKCKELFHVLLDDETKSRNMDIFGHVQEAATCFFKAESNPTSPVVWEALAEIAAMEFLLPFADRKAIISSSGGNPDYEAVSARYGIPQLFVEEYLSPHYMAEFENLV